MTTATIEYTALHDRLVAASHGHSLSSDRALMEQAAAAIDNLLTAAPTYRFDVSQDTKPIPATFVRALVAETLDDFMLLLSSAKEGDELAPLVRPCVEAVLQGLGLKIEADADASPREDALPAPTPAPPVAPEIPDTPVEGH